MINMLKLIINMLIKLMLFTTIEHNYSDVSISNGNTCSKSNIQYTKKCVNKFNLIYQQKA